jgi:hypothetical protein
MSGKSRIKNGPPVDEVLISFLGKIACFSRLIAAVESVWLLTSRHIDGPKD